MKILERFLMVWDVETQTQKGALVQYWDSVRLVKVVGKDGAISARYLEGADLKTGNDIRIEGGSSLPQSKAARIYSVD